MDRIELFMLKVRKEPNSCWTWLGSQSVSGYGQFWNGERNISAHHFLLAQPVPENMFACHKCDYRLCVNPDHIFVGTRSDNERDKVAKGRHNTAPGAYAMLAVRRSYSGAANPQSKLTQEQVNEVKNAPKIRGVGASLARKFGVTEACISAIRRGVNHG